ncbi:hypothetical protein SAMN05443662_1207 [Sulfurivirga caldicuralii]|uniref:Uncharacterized protein n=1 Tax=Sulfurivirga caldicuralii TaxID=364032 RepID=A0A1N6G5Y5_9GAMM|nr:DsrE family protein [Sulfurivirga caldicuralii]SIO02956.1 hypothetical protein SAMN05443662_1207 [Sulfurivirga caldicuralii]
MRIPAFISSLLLVLLILTTPARATEYGHQKVVYHLNYDNTTRQKAALRNLQNHINAVGAKNLTAQVVMHGKGITLLQTANEDQQLASKIDSLKLQRVSFKICANTIRKKKIPLDTLYDAHKDDIVPSGVAEIGHLQQQGFSYLRP